MKVSYTESILWAPSRRLKISRKTNKYDIARFIPQLLNRPELLTPTILCISKHVVFEHVAWHKNN